MSVNAFLARFGFDADPFASTNAEDEPRLGAYFVPPPYFTTVLGDPVDPKSQVVLAPRGSGKTAQRRMIEDQSEEGGYLCVTYDHFDHPAGFAVADADLAYHLNQLCRLLVIGVLAHLEEESSTPQALTEHQRQLLKHQVDRFLGDMSAREFKEGVQSIKSLGDKASDFWKKYAGPVAAGVQILLKKAGLDGVQVPSELVSEAKQEADLRYHFESLLEIARRVGFSSTYILVDKVDETALTGSNAEATFALIRPLLADLATLEANGAGFKFFLWDHIGDAYREQGGRPDRVQIIELSWTIDQLTEMLRHRLAAHSDGTVTSVSQMVCDEVGLDVDQLVAYLANGSPRDMIRLASAIIAETVREGPDAECVHADALWSGIRSFSDQRAQELAPNVLPELRKVQRPTFTINRVANDVYHVTHEAARSRIQKWMATGTVAQVGEVANRGNRPLHLYGIIDPRVAIAAQPAVDVPTILGNFTLVCPACRKLVVSAETALDCMSCGRAFNLSGSQTLLEVCEQ